MDVTRAAGRTLLRTLASSNRSHWMELPRNSTMQVFKGSAAFVTNLFLNNSIADTSMRVDISDDFSHQKDTIGLVVSFHTVKLVSFANVSI